jgi:hypothetical protein
VTVDAREESSELRTRVGRIQHPNITLDEAICGNCNNVWLSRLERAIRPFLAPMAVSAQPAALDARRQALIATWAVKTVLLFEMAIRQMNAAGRPIQGYRASAQELAWLRARSEPPPRSLVWLGCWDCQQAVPVNYAPSDAPLPAADGSPVAGHFTTFALGYVAARCSPSISWRPNSIRPRPGTRRFRRRLPRHPDLAAATCAMRDLLAAAGLRQGRLGPARNLGRRAPPRKGLV